LPSRSRPGRWGRTGSLRTPPSSASPTPRHRLLPRRQAATLLFTDAFPSARSHQGEDCPSPFICGCPGLRAKGERRVHNRAAAHVAGDAGHGARLGKFLAGVAIVVAARAASFVFLPHFLSRVSCPGRRIAVVVWVGAVVMAPACARARSSARPRARAPTHLRTLSGRQGRAFGSACPFAPSPPTHSSRRRGLCHAVALQHARAQGKGRAFRSRRVFSSPTKCAPVNAVGCERFAPPRRRERCWGDSESSLSYT
jgi:hypothetical protein